MKKFVSAYGSTTRRNVVVITLLLFTAMVLSRVVYLQVEHGHFLVGKGNSRYIRTKKTIPLRGTITDRKGIPLAVSTPVSSLWATSYRLAENPNNVKKLAFILNISPERLNKRLAKVSERRKKSLNAGKHDAGFMYLRRGLSPADAQKIMDEKIPGVHSMREYRRFYPSGAVDSQILGFNNIDDQGLQGLEMMYNGWLAGTPGKSQVIQDATGNIVDILKEISPPVPGRDLKLTIDNRLQYITHAALLGAWQKNNANSATAVMLDARTSEVLAMTSVPSGNPNKPSQRKQELLKNRAMTDTFEPGSTVKSFAIAAALKAGVVTPETEFDIQHGFYRIGRNRIRDTHDHGSFLSVAEIIQKSSNVGTCKVAMTMPKTTLHDMYRALGFGQKSQIAFTGEAKGVLNRFARLDDFSYCTNAFGYGVSVTALQLAQAYATLANDGIKIPVSLVKRDILPEGERIMPEQVAKQVKHMIAMAVEKEGTGKMSTQGIYIQDYRVGGKTGTAHKVINGSYSKHDYFSVFAGMAPMNNPRIVMVIMIDNPRSGVYYGGQVAAPVFADIVGKSLRILGVSPDRPTHPTIDKMPVVEVADRLLSR